MSAVFGSIHPAGNAVGHNERTLAKRCADGDLQAGVTLVGLLIQKEGAASVTRMLELAFGTITPSTQVTCDEVDNMCDAYALARRARESAEQLAQFRSRLLKECGLLDEDVPAGEFEQPESD